MNTTNQAPPANADGAFSLGFSELMNDHRGAIRNLSNLQPYTVEQDGERLAVRFCYFARHQDSGRAVFSCSVRHNDGPWLEVTWEGFLDHPPATIDLGDTGFQIATRMDDAEGRLHIPLTESQPTASL